MMNTQTFETQDAAQDRFEIACIEMIGGHTPRHGLEQEYSRVMPTEVNIENAFGDILDILEGKLFLLHPL